MTFAIASVSRSAGPADSPDCSDSESEPASHLGPWATSADLAYCRAVDGTILEVNLSFARKFGRNAAELRGCAVCDLLHAEDQPLLQQARDRLARPPHLTTSEHRWTTPQGVRWLAWEETAVVDPSGAVVAIRAVGHDITLQRLAEEQFYRLSRAVEQSPVSIVITDIQGRPQYVNAKFTEVTGHTLESLLDGNRDVLREGHADQASYDACCATVRAGGEWRGELMTSRLPGKQLWESVKISCLRGPSGEITNFLCLREDITERKLLEGQLRQAQKMESLGTLAGGIAHDFNNLLAVILGYSELSQGSSADAALRQKALREIHRAAERARGLVRQILTFSRKAEVHFSSVDLNQLVRDLVILLGETFPRTVVFQLELQEALPPLFADQTQVQQILLNLCVNARDAMPDGGTIFVTTRTCPAGSVPLAAAAADPARTFAHLQVTDTGAGMPPEVRQRIFEPFFTTKQAGKGTGLGLAVVYGIVVAHQGCIECDSMPGIGSTFNVYLPLHEGAPAATRVPPAFTLASGAERLLVVDDEEALRGLLCASLSSLGYQPTPAASGLEAIELLHDPARTFSAMLLDLNMPGATGIDVLKVARRCRPDLEVLVITGHLSPEARAELTALGQRTIIEKPYNLVEIGRQLRRVLDAPAMHLDSQRTFSSGGAIPCR